LGADPALIEADWLRARNKTSQMRSDDRQALAPFASAGREHLATAFGGHAGAKSDVTSALFAVGAECR
jgi:hypothetical protein